MVIPSIARLLVLSALPLTFLAAPATPATAAPSDPRAGGGVSGQAALSDLRVGGGGSGQGALAEVGREGEASTRGAVADVRVEGEGLLPAVDATAPVERQANCCGVVWSGGAQMWFRGVRAGDRVVVGFTVPASGRYDLSAVLTVAPDYGVLRLAVDDVPIGQPFNGYHTAVATRSVPFGPLQLSAGSHRLTITLATKDGGSMGFFAGLDVLNLRGIGPATTVTNQPYALNGATAAAGTFVKVYDPSIGETQRWYYNDHTMIRNVTTGEWHVFAITHAEPANPLDEKNFGHAIAPSPRGPWTKRPFALTASAAANETHIWAPHVIHHNGLYYMYYAAGTPDHSAYRMHLATSTDLNTWTRSAANPLFTDGFDARDPMVTRLGDQWVMYYTANATPSGGAHQVAYRTSTDLLHWSSKRIAFEHTAVGTFGGPTESPFVMQQGDWWYLFVCCDSAGYTDTRVYRSKNPLQFSQSDAAGRIPAHASEVVTEPDGTRWITGAGWGMGGLFLAPLRFDPGVVVRGRTISTPFQRLDVRTFPRAEIRGYGVDPVGAGQYRELLDASMRSTAPYVAVGGWGATDAATVPAAITQSREGDRISLRGIRFGDEPVTADWNLTVGPTTVDTDLVWQVGGATTATVWEVALGIDSALASVGDPGGADRDGDAAGFSRWVTATAPDATFAMAHRFGSAWSGDNRWFLRRHAVATWQSLWQPGGRAWPAGVYPGGHWRMGGSRTANDTVLADKLSTELNS